MAMRRDYSAATMASTILWAALAGCAAHTSSVPAQPAPAGLHATASGAALFHEKGCEHCHGANFAGIADKGPSLLTVGRRLKKDAIAKQIHDGGRQMPAFGDALQPDEISALAEMLAKKKKAPKGVPATPAIVP
jgi:mono/diheme cytochrome c family protein